MMMPTAELLVVETTRSAACPKQLSEYQEEPQEEKDYYMPQCIRG